MKENTNDNNFINEEEDDLIKINIMLDNVKKQNNEGNEFVKKKNYEEAEKIYMNAINVMNHFETKKKFLMDNEEKKNKGKEIIDLMKKLYSNLALCQGKLLKINEALQTSSYIISNLDAYHDKSYIRILMLLIEINELNAAEELKNEIKTKFFGKNLKVFETAFNLLKIKQEENDIKLKKKVKENDQKNLYDFNCLEKKNYEFNDNKNEINDTNSDEDNKINNDINRNNNVNNLINSISNTKYKMFKYLGFGLVGALGIFLLYKFKYKSK